MKKIFTPLVLIAILFVSACTKEKLVVKFGLNAKEVLFTVPATPLSGDMNFVLKQLDYNLDSIAKANSISISQIKSAKINTIDLDIIDQNQTTFNIVDSAEAFASVDNKPEILIGYKKPISKDNLRTIRLTIPDIEFADYLKSKTVQFRLKGRTNAPLPNDVQMRARISFNIQGQLIN